MERYNIKFWDLVKHKHEKKVGVIYGINNQGLSPNHFFDFGYIIMNHVRNFIF
jgi:hypothetical protein